MHTILRNPKYTGHMVFGRRHTTAAGKSIPVPAGDWLWSPQPTHPAIITRATWDAAQTIGAEHSTSRDGTGLSSHPATGRTYILPSRVRWCSCQRERAHNRIRVIPTSPFPPSYIAPGSRLADKWNVAGQVVLLYTRTD